MATARDDVLRKLNEAQDAELRPLPVSASQVARARAVVCARARDDADRELLLDALGLSGRRSQVTRRDPRTVRAQAVHGVGSGVAAHKWLDEPLCAACDRWMEVHLRKDGGASPDCGTYRVYIAHVKAGQIPDDACTAARRLYQNDQRAQKRQATPAPLADGGDA